MQGDEIDNGLLDSEIAWNTAGGMKSREKYQAVKYVRGGENQLYMGEFSKEKAESLCFFNRVEGVKCQQSSNLKLN